MLNRDQRKQYMKELHEPKIFKILRKAILAGVLALLIPLIVISMLDPRNWIYVVLALVIEPMWRY